MELEEMKAETYGWNFMNEADEIAAKLKRNGEVLSPASVSRSKWAEAVWRTRSPEGRIGAAIYEKRAAKR